MHIDATETRQMPGRLRRRQARYRNAAEIDGRTRAGRRTKELTRQFETAIGGALTDAQKLAIHRAAVLTAVAEDTRMRRLAGEGIPLDDLVRIDRLAAQAVRSLALPTSTRKPAAAPLREYLASASARSPA
jgi:hypothetical protein